MRIHTSYLERFHLLEGLTSFEQLRQQPELEQRFFDFLHAPGADAPDVPAVDHQVPGPHGPVSVRVYGARDGAGRRPGFMWVHGGAFVFGDLDGPEADRTAREVAHRADAVVVSVTYRHAVDGVSYPVPHDDCVAALRWVRDHALELGIDAHRIAVGGASAGANLATGAVLRVRDEVGWLPALLVPVYGVFHFHIPVGRTSHTAQMAGVPQVLRMFPESTGSVAANYVGGPRSSADGYAMPAGADLEALCPVLVLAAEYDDLRPSSEAFAAALALAGADVRLHTARGLLHGFLTQPAEIEPVGAALDLIAEAVTTTQESSHA